jgi:hypothetical protein
MSEKISKSPIQIQKQIELWFLNYNSKENELDGNELFTFFKLLNKQKQFEIIEKLNLLENEIPVLILNSTESSYIINTTHSFIKVENNEIEKISYKDFEGHEGFGFSKNIKKNNYIAPFGFLVKEKTC